MTQTSSPDSDPIRDWFTAHDDGEFSIPPDVYPYSFAAFGSGSRFLLYTTKPRSVIEKLASGPVQIPCGVFGRGGLPHERDAPWLIDFASRSPVLFLGDADPCDLLTYAWLKRHLAIAYLGVSDRLFHGCGVRIDRNWQIRQAPEELASHHLLREHLPELRELVGAECDAIITSGSKIELEALFSHDAYSLDGFLHALSLN